jgi:enamine deaminase RidA (YjgF/YER057c/UK114 family)
MTDRPAGAKGSRRYLKRDAAQARAYSQAVVTQAGRSVWLAGQVAAADAAGRSLAGDFDGQVREVFARLGQTLAEPAACSAIW